MQVHSKVKTVTLLICIIMCGCGLSEDNSVVGTVMPTSLVVVATSSQVLPEDTITPVADPKITLVPALPVIEAEIKLTEMLSNNGNCRLPCFWGFIPGKTKTETILSSINIYDALFNPTGGWAEIDITRGNLILETSLAIGDEHDTEIIRRLSITMAAYDGQRAASNFVYNSPVYTQYFRYYTLPYLLSTYGKPENIYIHFENEMYPHEYYLVLDYTKSGWVASFQMALGMKNQSGDILIGCPAEAFTTLILWSPEDIETAQKYGYAYGPGRLIPIEKATSLTLDEFYQQYKDPANTKCLETPANIQP